jgi:holo-[acyl-carrier protein] synthase
MIYGIGTDLVTVTRMREMHARFGERLARRVLAPSEWPDYERATDRVRLLARRFAAKEAVVKALGTGLRVPATLGNIAIGHDDLGRPEPLPAPALRDWLDARGIRRLHVSITDERDYAVAFAIAEL